MGSIILWLLLPIALLGCASAPPASPSITRPAQAERVPFNITGRLAVKHDGERSSATVRWTHSDETDEILLFAPLGQTVARIYRDDQGVILETSDKHYAAQDAGELTQQVLGWRLPLAGLQYWVLALPSPTSAFEMERYDTRQIRTLRQDGWTIDYARYATVDEDGLPQRLTLHREGMEIQLLIDEWQIH